MSNPKKNFIYNIIYQILIMIIPLITAPYLSRIVGANGVGIYSYTYSIVYYFMLLTLLGVNNYGNREIAKVKENKDSLSKTFWSIYLFQLIMGLIMLLIYAFYIVFFNIQYKSIALIQIIYIISAILDINWLFFGLEEFKKTITRNTFVKIGNVLLIFLFVKNTGDLWKYTLIMAGMTFLGQLLLWVIALNKIKFVKVKLKDILEHVKPNIILFIPVIAISLYKIMDKIMLGKFTNVQEVGFYENAEKIINIPLMFITALGTVMLPRISNIVSKGDKKQIKKYIDKSICFVMFLSCAMCMGLITIGNNFAPLYFGNEFEKAGILIQLLAITLPFISFANVLRTQYLIPMEKDNIYIKSVSLGAVSNLIMNLIFIPKLSSIGACIGTIIAEFLVMFYQSMSIRKEIEIRRYFFNTIPFLLKSFVMLLIIYSFNFINMNLYLKLIIQIIFGLLIYLILNIKYIKSVINFNKIKSIGRKVIK